MLGGPLRENHDLKPGDPIVEDDQMECVYETVEKDDQVIMRRVMKNAFVNSEDETMKLESLWMFSCPRAHLVLTREDWKVIRSARGDFLLDDDDDDEERGVGVESGASISGQLMDLWDRVYLRNDWEEEEIAIPDPKKLRVRFPRFLDPRDNEHQCWSLDRIVRAVSWVSELKEGTKYGHACVRAKGWDEDPDISAVKYETYENIYEKKMGIRVWRDTKTKTTYLMKSRVYETQEKIMDWIKTNGRSSGGGCSIHLVKAEIDDDHEDPEGYFDFLSGLVTKDSLIITTCARRVAYLYKHTEMECVVFFPSSLLSSSSFTTTRREKTYETVIVDRTHVLGLEEFVNLLEEITEISPKKIYFCGSVVCQPENGTIGCPFSDMVLSGNFETVDTGKNYDFRAILDKKVGKIRYYPNLIEATKSCTRSTVEKSYVFVSSGKQKRAAVEGESYVDDNGRKITLSDDQVKHFYQIRYDLPARPTLFLLINKDNEKGRLVSHTHLIKCLSCSSTNPESVIIVGGTREDVNRIRSHTRWRTSTLRIWIVTHSQPPGSPNRETAENDNTSNRDGASTREDTKKRKINEGDDDSKKEKENKTKEDSSPRTVNVAITITTTTTATLDAREHQQIFTMCPICKESIHYATRMTHMFEKHLQKPRTKN